MSTQYVTREGDMLDDICRKIYGEQKPGQVEAVLAANPGLAARGFIYPSGLLIILPTLEAKAEATVRLW